MVAISQPVNKKRRVPDSIYRATSPLMAFNEEETGQFNDSYDPVIRDDLPPDPAPQKIQKAEMEPMSIEAEKPYDFTSELRLLKDYGLDVEDQAAADHAYSNSARDITNQISQSRLNPEQLRKISENQAAIRGIGAIMSGQSNLMHVNGQTYQIGPNWQQVYKDSTEGALASSRAPIENANYLVNAAKDDFGFKTQIGNQERMNLKARGENLKNYADVNKRVFDIKELQNAEDPSHPKSKFASQALQDILSQRMIELDKPPEQGGEKRDRYRNLLPVYQKFMEIAKTANFNQVQKLIEILKVVDKDAADKVTQDIREKGYEFEKAKFGLLSGGKAFDERKELGKLADNYEKTKRVVSQYDKLIALANDPEVKLGLGQKLNTKIKDWTGNLTPKQAQFRALMMSLSAPEQHAIYAGSVTDGENDQRNIWLPTENDSLATFLGKTEGLKSNNVSGLHRAAQQHFNLATGKDYNTSYGLNLDPQSPNYQPQDETVIRTYNPYQLTPTAGSNGQVKFTAETTKKKGGSASLKNKVKIATPELLQRYMKAHPGSTMDDAIRKAKESNYIIGK